MSRLVMEASAPSGRSADSLAREFDQKDRKKYDGNFKQEVFDKGNWYGGVNIDLAENGIFVGG